MSMSVVDRWTCPASIANKATIKPPVRHHPTPSSSSDRAILPTVRHSAIVPGSNASMRMTASRAT
jgi:hypothetical protein